VIRILDIAQSAATRFACFLNAKKEEKKLTDKLKNNVFFLGGG
jgi:hypothetical protein